MNFLPRFQGVGVQCAHTNTRIFMKKALLSIIFLLILGAGTLFLLKGKDGYEASRYSATLSNGIAVGSSVEFTLPDQFDKSQTLDVSTQTLILAFSKQTGHIVKEFLGAQGADYLTSRHAIFIADISPMPVVIRNTFALPDLKSQNYSVNLIYDKTIAENFKKGIQGDKIVIVTLNNKEIQKVEYASTAQELQAALQ